MTLQVCSDHSVASIIGLLKSVTSHSDIANNKMTILSKQFFYLLIV